MNILKKHYLQHIKYTDTGIICPYCFKELNFQNIAAFRVHVFRYHKNIVEDPYFRTNSLSCEKQSSSQTNSLVEENDSVIETENESGLNKTTYNKPYQQDDF